MNFKNYVACSVVLAAFGLVGCVPHYTAPVAVASPSTVPAVVVPVTPPAPSVDPLLVSGEGWSLKVPDDNWEVADKDSLTENVLFRAENTNLPARAMLLADPFPGNQNAFTAIVAGGAVKNGAKVSKPVTMVINGNNFNLVNAVSGNLHIQMWTLVKNGNGYAFMCGAPSNNPKIPTVCVQIANTLHID